MNKWELIKFKRFYIAKETINKKKKKTFRMTGNICKWNNWQGINFQNIQTAYAAQYTKKEEENPIKKMGRRSK